MYSNDNEKNAIRELQQNLRGVPENRSGKNMVPIDGIYGNATREAVRSAQGRYGLPQTGAVDYQTWNGIFREYEAYQILNRAPNGILPFPEQLEVEVEKEEISDLVTIIQIMLNTVTVGYNDWGILPVNGVYNSETEEAVRAFQLRQGMTPTGVVDKATWNMLADNYEKYKKAC